VGQFLDFFIKYFFKKEDVPYNEFLEDLGLLIIKDNFPIQFVESKWLKHFILHLSKIKFPFLNAVFTRDIARVS
jgi:hypothetical protein